MKREGPLDEIEKLVDESWNKEEKGINTHIDSYKNHYNKWIERDREEQQRSQEEQFRDQYLRSIRERAGWGSPMPDGEFDSRRPRMETLQKDCRCGTKIKALYKTEYPRYEAFDLRLRPTDLQVDHFYCPRCREMTRVTGKIIELTINMTE